MSTFAGLCLGLLLGLSIAWFIEDSNLRECKRLQEDTRRIQEEAREILESLQPALSVPKDLTDLT